MIALPGFKGSGAACVRQKYPKRVVQNPLAPRSGDLRDILHGVLFAGMADDDVDGRACHHRAPATLLRRALA